MIVNGENQEPSTVFSNIHTLRSFLKLGSAPYFISRVITWHSCMWQAIVEEYEFSYSRQNIQYLHVVTSYRLARSRVIAYLLGLQSCDLWPLMILNIHVRGWWGVVAWYHFRDQNQRFYHLEVHPNYIESWDLGNAKSSCPDIFNALTILLSNGSRLLSSN